MRVRAASKRLAWHPLEPPSTRGCSLCGLGSAQIALLSYRSSPIAAAEDPPDDETAAAELLEYRAKVDSLTTPVEARRQARNK